LGALANYGGPTQTMALLPGSPAIDAGSAALAPSEIQDVTVTGSAGTFTLTFNGQTTGSLAFNAAASRGTRPTASLQNALNALSTIGGVGGSVTVTKASNVYHITFGGSLAQQNLPALVGLGSGGATTTTLSVVDGYTDQRGITRTAIPDIGAYEAGI